MKIEEKLYLDKKKNIKEEQHPEEEVMIEEVQKMLKGENYVWEVSVTEIKALNKEEASESQHVDKAAARWGTKDRRMMAREGIG